jgi:ABC-2 type transport system permease protein
MTRWLYIKTLIIKEFFTVWQDKKIRFTLIALPLLQLIIFTRAATLDLSNISLGIYNQDSGPYSRELIQRIKGSPPFKHVYEFKNLSEVKEAIDRRDIIVSLQIQQNFSALISQGKSAPLQMILDGRKPTSAQIVSGYIISILQKFDEDIPTNKGVEILNPIRVEFRAFFNPNLNFVYYNIPCLVAILSMFIALTLTALSVSRERELGTFAQLLVSPLQPWEILVGKLIPALIISIAESTLLMIAALYVFKTSFAGSFTLLYFSMVVFLLSIVGVGLCISSISQTQQQSILGSFVFVVPAVLLSGFVTPIENMPVWLQSFTNILPIKHFLIIIKGLFLKNMPASAVLTHTWVMALIALFTLSLAVWMFKKRIE